MKIPVTYCKLQDLISSKVTRIRQAKEDGPPLTKWTELVQ